MPDSGQQQIYCTINNCHYFQKGNICKAEKILVTSDTMAVTLTQQVDAPYAAQITETPAAKCPETCCKTFVPRNDYSQNVDGVMKQE